MILSSPDVASAAKWSAIWEFCEYASEGLVFLGCVGEYIAEYTEWRTPEARHSLGRRSLLLLILGLGTGLFSLIKTNALAGSIIGSLGEQVGQAGEKAERASTSLGTALSKATQAETASSDALSNSRQAQKASSTAMTLARGARQEADSFEKDIVSAKSQAAAAESHLAEALKQAAEATAELNRLKAPRTIVDIPGLVTTLRMYRGTEFMFGGVFGDDESMELLKQLDAVLGQAGWRRIKHSEINIGIPAVQIAGRDDLVNLSVKTGVRVEVDVTEAPEVIINRPPGQLPPLVRLAVSLNEALQPHISPVEPTNPDQRVNLAFGSSKVLRIIVGKKP